MLAAVKHFSQPLGISSSSSVLFLICLLKYTFPCLDFRATRRNKNDRISLYTKNDKYLEAERVRRQNAARKTVISAQVSHVLWMLLFNSTNRLDTLGKSECQRKTELKTKKKGRTLLTIKIMGEKANEQFNFATPPPHKGAATSPAYPPTPNEIIAAPLAPLIGPSIRHFVRENLGGQFGEKFHPPPWPPKCCHLLSVFRSFNDTYTRMVNSDEKSNNFSPPPLHPRMLQKGGPFSLVNIRQLYWLLPIH